MLRKAFTMIELVFIITILGILTAVMIPRLQTSYLQEATDQFIKHIRLAKSLALAQDFYLGDSTQSNDYTILNQQNKEQRYWFKRWWRVQSIVGSNTYSIFSDSPTINNDSSYSGVVEYVTPLDNVAVDSQTGQYLSIVNPPALMGTSFANVDLAAAYDVSITMPVCSSVGGNTGVTRAVLFDNLGRPHCDRGAGDNSLNPYDRLMNTQMKIVLTELSSNEIINICIERESGFIHVCQ